ncbi:M56 family metallopeptidase [Joostella sp.]|uniref:M56 family metallopeptidase n=1 Tax=Joostella sp. TaxID=2231138 RepID=UPI003A957895
MEAFLTYNIKVAIVLILFWGLYNAFLKRETFFQGNRWFLSIGLFTSVILPVISFKTIKIIDIPARSTNEISLLANKIPESISIYEYGINIIFYIYIIGVIFFLLKFIIQLLSLYNFIRKENKQKENRNIILTDKNISPFSFFNYIVYNPNLYKDEELKTILDHEKIHVKQYHSLDVILIHLYTIVFWINPFAWIYKKQLTQNLEYIADEETTAATREIKDYQYLLLKQINGMQYSIINPFYNSLIKKRIVMLQKQKSSRINLIKFAAILPLLAGFMLLFSFKTVTEFNYLNEEESSKQLITKHTINNQLGDPIYVVDGKVMPKDFDVKSIDPKDIHSMNVIKGENAIKKYGDKAKSGAIEIFLKVSNQLNLNNDSNINNAHTHSSKIYQKEEPLYVVDGKVVDKDSFKFIEPDNIARVYVLKDEKAVDKYGDQGKNGVIEIILKSEDEKNKNSDSDIIIRETAKAKTATLNNKITSEQLILVNGKEVSHEDYKKINPDEIISIFKTDAAVKKYGDKGKNGVIMIYTKSNKE